VPSTPSTDNGRDPALDGLRGLAVAMVVLFHSAAIGGAPQWFKGGFLGVSLFFVLSGMLMALVVLRSADGPDGRVAAGPYLARRARRLLPASLAVVVACTLLTRPSWSAWPGMQAGDAWAAATAAMNWHVIDLGSAQLLRGLGPLGPYWSLAVEWQFYVLLLLVCVVPFGRLVSRLWALAAVAVVGGTLLQLVGGGDGFVREFGTDRRLVELGIGIGLGLLLHRGTLRSVTPRSARLWGGGALLVMLGLFAVADFDPPWLLHGGFGLVALVSAALVVTARTPGPLRRVWSSSPLVTLGRDSYSLYLVHWPIGQLLARHTDVPPALFVVLAVGATVAIGGTLARTVERPAQRLRWSTSTTLLAALAATLATGLIAELVIP